MVKVANSELGILRSIRLSYGDVTMITVSYMIIVSVYIPLF